MSERQQKTVCPHCQHWDSLVVKGWSDPRGYTRRRECAQCHQTYKTREVLVIGTATTRYRPATT